MTDGNLSTKYFREVIEASGNDKYIEEYLDPQEKKIDNRRITEYNRLKFTETPPWSKHNRNKSLPPPTQEWIRDRIIDMSKRSLRNACWASILYITGCRLCELIPSSQKHYITQTDPATNVKTRVYQEGGDTIFPGIKIKDLILTWVKDNNTNMLKSDMLHIISRCEKRRKLVYKRGYIAIRDNNVYEPMLLIIDNYIRDMTGKYLHDFEDIDYALYGDKQLFPIGTSMARKITKKTFGMDIDVAIVREWRIQHLVKYHFFNTSMLMKYINWASVQTSIHYTEITDAELQKQMQETSDADD